MSDPEIAFLTAPAAHPLEVRVNFGVFAGREATQAELDELAQALLPVLGQVSVVSERRVEVDETGEASIHQVRIELGDAAAPLDEVLALAKGWARDCIAERHAEITEA